MKDVTINANSVVILENKGTENVSFRYYGVNFSETLAPEDKVILTPSSSEAFAYYMALNDEEKGLNVSQSESNSETVVEEPVVEPEEPETPEEGETVE